IRAEVVVPMQTFSYLPGPTFRTPGAVCSRNAPFKSIGGSTPWSKMRMCVRSRMPMMWPSTTTSSPARSLRVSSCVVGKGRPLDLAFRLALPPRPAMPGRPPRGPARVVAGDRVERHVRARVLDVALQHGHVPAETHRADSGLVQELVQLLFELRDVRIGVLRTDRTRDRLLREVHRVVRGTADPDADDSVRARP